MLLGRVVGCVWATQKDPNLSAQRLLIVQPVRPDLEPSGKHVLCLDSTGAGPGQVVYWCRGKESSFPFLPAQVPTDSTIVGIVDCIHVGGKDVQRLC